MSTVKISDLPTISTITANTSNTIFVGVNLENSSTGKISAKTIAQGLYSNNPLNVGTNPILLPNTVAQFANTSNNYIQINLVNADNDGTADYVVTANTGSDTANYIDLGFTNSDYNSLSPYNSLGTAIGKLDGYLYVQGGITGGNLVIGTTSANTETRFLCSGINASNVIAKITSDSFELQDSFHLKFGDGSSLSTASAPYSYSNAAYALANSTVTNTNSYISSNVAALNSSISSNVSTINGSITSNVATINGSIAANVVTINGYISSNISSVFGQANAAYAKANAALANATGTFGGTLSVANDLNVNGIVSFANSNFTSSHALLTIKGTANTQAPSTDGYMIQVSGKANVHSRVILDSYGANVFGIVTGRSARGTVDSPTSTSNNDVLMRFSGNGWGSSGFSANSLSRIDIVASENYTNSARGTRIEFWNTTTGSNTINRIATFNADSANFTGKLTPEKGIAYIPRILTGAQTAITIDFSTDSIVRATHSATVTIGFSNYVIGKVVDLWITNTAGNGQTINHGCLANNSTMGSTSFSLTSGRTAHLRYMSIDGDLANTFVSAVYS